MSGARPQRTVEDSLPERAFASHFGRRFRPLVSAQSRRWGTGLDRAYTGLDPIRHARSGVARTQLV